MLGFVKLDGSVVRLGQAFNLDGGLSAPRGWTEADAAEWGITLVDVPSVPNMPATGQTCTREGLVLALDELAAADILPADAGAPAGTPPKIFANWLALPANAGATMLKAMAALLDNLGVFGLTAVQQRRVKLRWQSMKDRIETTSPFIQQVFGFVGFDAPEKLSALFSLAAAFDNNQSDAVIDERIADLLELFA